MGLLEPPVSASEAAQSPSEPVRSRHPSTWTRRQYKEPIALQAHPADRPKPLSSYSLTYSHLPPGDGAPLDSKDKGTSLTWSARLRVTVFGSTLTTFQPSKLPPTHTIFLPLLPSKNPQRRPADSRSAPTKTGGGAAATASAPFCTAASVAGFRLSENSGRASKPAIERSPRERLRRCPSTTSATGGISGRSILSIQTLTPTTPARRHALRAPSTFVPRSSAITGMHFSATA